ncbi:hypothetical protein [Neobacillus cucumis]|uniref:hypothetical protein n=1 Tax=Neobacillus cucumis TaxID=1740721 RepID=UPI001966C195|nr:hypothetical protein [Neobacillus cucumis]MBM7653882.1 hypothetical protein [Neobacillus cucumis]
MIRTERAGKGQGLSEYKGDSDRASWKRPRAVRIQGRFGQSELEKAKGCPNTRVIRTERAERSQELSEYKDDSDRASGKKPRVVRIQG